MKHTLLTIIILTFTLGCSTTEAPEGMFPIDAAFTVLEEKKVIKRFALIDTGNAPLPAAVIQFHKPEEFKGNTYLTYKLPHDPELPIFEGSVGKKFQCSVVKHALVISIREFNSGALTNVKHVETN